MINPFQFIIVSKGIRSSNNCYYVYKEILVIDDNLNDNIINIESDREDDCMIIDSPCDDSDESIDTTLVNNICEERDVGNEANKKAS